MTSALLVVGGIAVGLFAKQAALNTFTAIKQAINPKHTPLRIPPSALPKIPIDHTSIQLSMNPAHVQQTNFDLLEKARQYRLEAIQAQKEQTLSEQATRPKSFRKFFTPSLSPVSEGTSV